MLMVIMAVDSNKEFPSPASPILTSWKGSYSERSPVTKTIWALPADTSLSGPEFQYMKALNQMTSVVSFEICKFVSSWVGVLAVLFSPSIWGSFTKVLLWFLK